MLQGKCRDKVWDRGCEWLHGVYLKGLVRIPFFAEGTRQLLQAPYHGYTGFFNQGATTQPTTAAQAQYCKTNKDGIGIPEEDVQ